MNIKIPATETPVIDLIRNRWSPRSFADRPISETDLKTLFEAASWAFSAINLQPWKFIYAHKADTAAFEKLHHCLLPGNQPWAKNAAVLIAVLAEKKMANGGINKTAVHDVGAANATMMLQATSMGIYGHVMAGFDADLAATTLEINPEEKEPVVFIALGYLAEPEKLEEPFKTREITPRTRKPVSEFAKPLKDLL